MRSAQTETMPNVRGYLTVCVSQLVLTALAVLVSRMDLGGRIGAMSVMGVATANGLLVAIMLLGVRREGRLISVLALGLVVVLVGLLIWPAWDVAERARLY